jgi:hypothetical protein
VRIFKTKAFTRFVDKAGITDLALCGSIRDAERGLIAADLGGGVIKQRIARPGRGKSGGYRTLIVFGLANAPSSFMASPRVKGQYRERRVGRPQETRSGIVGLRWQDDCARDCDGHVGGG